MRKFTYITQGKEVTYLGWNRQISSNTKHLALIQDDDCLDVLAIDDPTQLDGVVEYIEDNPYLELIGIWKLAVKPVEDPLTSDRVAHLFSVSNQTAMDINDHLIATLSQKDYDTLMNLLS